MRVDFSFVAPAHNLRYELTNRVRFKILQSVWLAWSMFSHDPSNYHVLAGGGAVEPLPPLGDMRPADVLCLDDARIAGHSPNCQELQFKRPNNSSYIIS